MTSGRGQLFYVGTLLGLFSSRQMGYLSNIHGYHTVRRSFPEQRHFSFDIYCDNTVTQHFAFVHHCPANPTLLPDTVCPCASTPQRRELETAAKRVLLIKFGPADGVLVKTHCRDLITLALVGGSDGPPMFFRE